MSTSLVSRVPDVLNYLVSTFQAAPTLGAATPPVAVYDGPATTDADEKLILWVGLDDPDTTSAPLAARSDRAWSGQAGQSETIAVSCVAEAWSGEDDVRIQRTAVYGIVAAVETLVRTDTAYFGGTAMLANPGVTAAELRQNNTDRGSVARVSFQIILQAT